jgi:hypothetical protein
MRSLRLLSLAVEQEALPLENSPTLALQLQFAVDVSLSCCGLVSAAPDGPCNDVSRANAALGQTHCDASDLLNRPADQLTF